MTKNCNPLKCEGYALGWCEYDFATDTVYPLDEEKCLILKGAKM